MQRYLQTRYNKLSSGDRVDYMVTSEYNDRGSHASISPYCKDPLYVHEKNLGISIDYYVNKQLKGPITRFFEPILSHSPEEEFFSLNARKGIDTSHLRNKVKPGYSNVHSAYKEFKQLENCLFCSRLMNLTKVKKIVSCCFEGESAWTD